mgnify:CR=1 FL=1
MLSKMKKSKANTVKALNAAEKELLDELFIGGYAEFELTPDQRRLAREWAKQGLLERHRCSITKAYYYGFGHNADPYEGYCCNYANKKFVIPARFKQLIEREGKQAA